MEWQPISTAPKDRDILVGVWVWLDADMGMEPLDPWWSCWVIDYGTDGCFGNDGLNGDEPTHWLPIVPPEEAAATVAKIAGEEA